MLDEKYTGNGKVVLLAGGAFLFIKNEANPIL